MAKHIRKFNTVRDTGITIERWIEPFPEHQTFRPRRHLIDETSIRVATSELAFGITLNEQDLIALRDHLTAIIEADQP